MTARSRRARELPPRRPRAARDDGDDVRLRPPAPRDPPADLLGPRPRRPDRAARGRSPPRDLDHRGPADGGRGHHPAGALHLQARARHRRTLSVGNLVPTGLRPTFLDKFEKRGVPLPAGLFLEYATGFGSGGRAMKVAVQLGLAALVASALVASASAAGQLRVVEAGGAVYPALLHPDAALAEVAPGLGRARDREREPGRRLTVARQGTAATKTAVVLVIDESLTMKGQPIENAFAAARTFAAQANPAETIAVVTFNGKVNIAAVVHDERERGRAALSRPPTIAYGTKNYDALAQALAADRRSRRADGLDHHPHRRSERRQRRQAGDVLGARGGPRPRLLGGPRLARLQRGSPGSRWPPRPAAPTSRRRAPARSGRSSHARAPALQPVPAQLRVGHEPEPARHGRGQGQRRPRAAVTAYTTPALHIVPAPSTIRSPLGEDHPVTLADDRRRPHLRHADRLRDQPRRLASRATRSSRASATSWRSAAVSAAKPTKERLEHRPLGVPGPHHGEDRARLASSGSAHRSISPTSTPSRSSS